MKKSVKKQYDMREKNDDFPKFENWTVIKWELIRWNNEYRSDFRKVVQLRQSYAEKGGSPWRYEDSKEGYEEHQLCKKWTFSLRRLLDPDRDIDQLSDPALFPSPPDEELSRWSETQLKWYKIFNGQMRKGVFTEAIKIHHIDHDLVGKSGRHYLLDNSKMVIEIDFDSVNSVSRLKKEVSDLIDHHIASVGFHSKVEIDKKGNHKLVVYDEGRTKKNMKDFKPILEVGDLSRQNLLADQITERLNPDLFLSKEQEDLLSEEELEEHLTKTESAKRNTYRMLKKYNELVKDGWRLIVPT